MTNPALEQALIELEESLAQIKSANDNVNAVSQKSEQLILTMTGVISSFNSISTNINIDKEVINKQLDENGKVLTNGISKLLKDADNKYAQIESHLDSHQAKFTKGLEYGIHNTELRLNGIIHHFNQAANDSIAQVNSQIQSLGEKMNSAAENITKFELALSELESRIKQIDFKDDFSKLDRTIKKRSNLLLGLNICMILAMLGAILIRWIKF